MLTLVLGVILGAFIYYKLIKQTRYWAERNITHIPAWPIVGSIWELITRKKHFLEVTVEFYKKFPNDRYIGYNHFTSPSLIIKDLDLIKKIGIKEFESFHDRLYVSEVESDPLFSKSLLNLGGNKWKQMRATLSPAFTSRKIKDMFHLMVECAEDFVSYFEGKEQVDVEMKELFGRFANGVIASTAFGISVNAVKEPNHEFYQMAQRITDMGPFAVIKIVIFALSAKVAKLLNLRMMRQNVADFFTSIIKNNMNKRIKDKIVRPDLIHLLMEARKGNLQHEEQKENEGFATVEESHVGIKTERMDLTDDHIVAQALVFFSAGFETVSTALSVMAHELAANPDVQKKLQEEIDSVRQKYDGKVPYEAIISMKYLDQVVCESLRLWPPVFQTSRFSNKEFTVAPISSQERTFVIEKGITIAIPIMAIHRDPKYFSEPDRFDPERFNDENKSKIIPGSYMPFGVGPRNCIGSRFALLEMKILFFYLLGNFDLVPNEKTVIPLKVSPKKMTISPENGFHLGLKPRS